MKPGDLVQSCIFNKEGSGAYGLVMTRAERPQYWVIAVPHYEDAWETIEGGTHEVHEEDLIVVNSAGNK